jgi:hypothetical protein
MRMANPILQCRGSTAIGDCACCGNRWVFDSEFNSHKCDLLVRQPANVLVGTPSDSPLAQSERWSCGASLRAGKSQCPWHSGDRATRNSETVCSPTTSTAATKAVCEYILSKKATRAGAGRGKAEDTGGPRVAGVPAKRKAAAGAAQRAPAPKRTRTAAPANTATATPLSEEAHRRQLMREGKQRAPRQEEKPPIIFF